jgi:hypothetical protein
MEQEVFSVQPSAARAVLPRERALERSENAEESAFERAAGEEVPFLGLAFR